MSFPPPFSVTTTAPCNHIQQEELSLWWEGCVLQARSSASQVKGCFLGGISKSQWICSYKDSAGRCWRPLIQTFLDLGAFETEVEGIMNDTLDRKTAQQHEQVLVLSLVPQYIHPSSLLISESWE